jgi:hypothetical protein
MNTRIQKKAYPAIFIFSYLVLSTVPLVANDRFIDNGDGTVTDRTSGLMWAQTDNQFDILWKQAQNWSKKDFPNTRARKYKNWRLPTLIELESLFIEGVNYDGYETDCGHHAKTVPQIKLSCIPFGPQKLPWDLPWPLISISEMHLPSIGTTTKDAEYCRLGI